MRYLIISFFSILSLRAASQITAMGQGGKLVVWGAFAFDQALGRKFVNRFTVAYSRHSTLDNTAAFQQFGTYLIRNELAYRINKNFRISGTIEHADRAFYDSRNPSHIYEFNFFPILYNDFEKWRIRFTQYIRPEIRFFNGPGFAPVSRPFQFRPRYMFRADVPLKKQYRFIAITEFFAGIDRQVAKTEKWGRFTYTENRTSLYIRKIFHKPALVFDGGVMLQTWMDNSINAYRKTLIFQFDVILENPFSKKVKPKAQ